MDNSETTPSHKVVMRSWGGLSSALHCGETITCADGSVPLDKIFDIFELHGNLRAPPPMQLVREKPGTRARDGSE